MWSRVPSAVLERDGPRRWFARSGHGVERLDDRFHAREELGARLHRSRGECGVERRAIDDGADLPIDGDLPGVAMEHDLPQRRRELVAHDVAESALLRAPRGRGR